MDFLKTSFCLAFKLTFGGTINLSNDLVDKQPIGSNTKPLMSMCNFLMAPVHY